MSVIPAIAGRQQEFSAWRRELHAHPELGYQEQRTSDFVAAKLDSLGLAVHRGLAKTGVVGLLERGRGGRLVGLRADMDALPIAEQNGFAHRSQNEGRMHACGHDGHTAMLLAAAAHLAADRGFEGRVAFIFQPAEENLGGGEAMIKDGLFERFPCEAVFGMHNWPALPPGQFAVHPGTVMAAADFMDVRIVGRGAHAAMPQNAVDPIVAAAQVVNALQTTVSREVSPTDSAVVSITKLAGGSTYNVIPDAVELKGTLRTLSPESRARLKARVQQVIEAVCTAVGAEAQVRFLEGHPATVNTEPEARLAAAAAAAVVGRGNVQWAPPPSMGAEDFSYMLQRKPGCYLWVGNGGEAEGRGLHSARYDFNDGILAIGASYWVRLVEEWNRAAAA